MEIKNIAILGARGNVGTAIITELLKSPTQYTITAISRSTTTTPYTPPPTSTSTITRHSLDYASAPALEAAFAGQDAVIDCVTGSATQFEASKRIVDAAVAAGVPFFFANEFVGNIHSPQFRRLPEEVAGAKWRIREYLEGVGRSGGMRWTAVNGGPFFDMWLMKGPAGFSVKDKQARIYGTGENPLYWTPLSVIGKAVVSMLEKNEAVANRGLFISPFAPGALTQNKLLATLEKVLDAKFEVTKVDIAEINKNAKISLEKGEFRKAMRGFTFTNQFYEEDCGNNLEGMTENELLGIEEMSVEEAVRQALETYGTDCPVVESMFKVDASQV